MRERRKEICLRLVFRQDTAISKKREGLLWPHVELLSVMQLW